MTIRSDEHQEFWLLLPSIEVKVDLHAVRVQPIDEEVEVVLVGQVLRYGFGAGRLVAQVPSLHFRQEED